MKKQGFTMMELLVAIVIIAIILVIASNPLFAFLSQTKTKQNAISLEQLMLQARSTAKTRSENIDVLFSTDKAEAVNSNGEVVNSVIFEDKIKYDATQSTISGNKITFNFQGSPLGADGEPSSFTEDSGKITICYYSETNENCLYSKTITILPVTGIVKLN